MIDTPVRRRPVEKTPIIARGIVAHAIVSLSLATFAFIAPLADTLAQSFPDRPISLIVPWAPGGTTDRHLRLLADIVGHDLGQPVVVLNQPGASGTLGPGNMALNAKPDGYTLAQFPSGMLRLPHMQKTAWHPIDDFTFIIGVSGYTLGFTVRINNPDGPTVVELKTGVRLPDGSVVTILGRYVQKTLGAGVSEIISLFSGFVLPAGIFPAGAYTIEAALLEPDLGVTISRHSVTVTVLP